MMIRGQHAAVIGIDAYERGIAVLRSAVADARAVAAALERDHHYSSPHLLLDGEATGAAILHLLETTLRDACGPDDAVILYYAGHGVALGDGEEEPAGFLLPQDARPGDESSWLSMDRVRKALSKLPCKHLLVILDCCFAGSFRWASSRSFVPVGRPLYRSQYGRFLAGTAWQVLTSASHQQKAYEVAPGRRNTRDDAGGSHRSPFAAALLRGLAGAADSSRGSHAPDGVITATELHQFIDEELASRGIRSRQTPGLWPLKPDNTGEFLFEVPGQQVATLPDPPLDEDNNPWLGLRSYGEEDAALFFGRERVVGEILDRLFDSGGSPLLVVVGASGTGKSSAVQAGVLPQLEKGSEEPAGTPMAWTLLRLPRLQDDPGQQLEAALGKLPEAPPGRRKLLFIDQFEELYVQCPDSERRTDFLARLRDLMRGEDPWQVLLTMRSDFEPRLAASQELGPFLAEARYPVPAMKSEELREVIERPAQGKALYFEPDALVGELVDEVMAMPGGLPLLSFALAEMYRQARLRRRETGAYDRAITQADCDAAGGVVEALHRRADDLYEAAEPARQITIRRLFLRMVSQEGGRLARRRVEERELVESADPEEQARARRVLADYIAARLLVADEGYVEPAHDTLILAWERLHFWLDEDGSQELLRQLWAAASAWDAARQEKGEKEAAGLLWNQDPRLPLVGERYLGRRRPWHSRLREGLRGRSPEAMERPTRSGELNRFEIEFAERSAARKRSRRKLAVGLTAAVMLTLFGATWYSFVQATAARRSAKAEQEARAVAEQERQRAEERRKQAEAATAAANASAEAERLAKGVAEDRRRQAEAAASAERLARRRAQDIARVAIAGEWLARDPTRAALVTLEMEEPGETASASVQMHEALTAPLADTVLRHESAVWGAVFSHGGQRVVTASEDGTVRVWPSDGTGEPATLPGLPDGVIVGLSPDGRRAVTAAWDDTARIWSTDGIGEPIVLRGHQDSVIIAAFSPDGQRVVTGSRDGTARIWNADGTGEPVILHGHQNWVQEAAFSLDGQRVVTASLDNTARVWRADGSGPAVVLAGHTSRVRRAVFSPDGTVVLTLSEGIMRIWPADGSSDPVVHRGYVQDAVFSHDGRSILVSSLDRAEILPAGGFGLAVNLEGHTDDLLSAAFSPDDQLVVTSSRDNTVRIWRADGYGTPVILRGHDDLITGVAFSPNGDRLVTTSRDRTARVWSSADTGGTSIFDGHRDWVMHAFFRAGGLHVIAATDERTVQVRPADGSGKPVTLRGHGDRVTRAAASGDGRRIVTASDDRTARVWAADGSGKTVVLHGHRGRVSDAALSPDGERVVTVSDEDGTLRIWAVDGTKETIVREGLGNLWRAAFDSRGRRIVTASRDGMVQVWSSDGSGALVDFREPHKQAFSVAFSPDGSRVVIGSGDRAWVRAADGIGEPMVLLHGAEGDARDAGFSPDGKYIFTVAFDGTARIWSAAGSGGPLMLQGGRISSLAFEPDGRHVVTFSAEGVMQVWPIEERLLQATLRRAINTCLDPEFRVSELSETRNRAEATYRRCRRCLGPWRRDFDARAIRAAPDDAWTAWQVCMNQP